MNEINEIQVETQHELLISFEIRQFTVQIKAAEQRE